MQGRAHAASALGAFPSACISGLEARYFLPSAVSWRLRGHLHTSEDTSEYSHWKRHKTYLKKLKDLTEVFLAILNNISRDERN